MNRAYYSGTIADFVLQDKEQILGLIALQHEFAQLEIRQRNAWLKQIEILKDNLHTFSGKIYFEFAIPRMGKRVDNIIIINNCIFIIEFKIGSTKFDKYAKDQVLGYALDMNNFHEGSHNKKIIPILVADKAPETHNSFENLVDNLYNTVTVNAINISTIISEAIEIFKNDSPIDIFKWESSPYKPTPTIVEAAIALFQNHSVEEITHHGAKNLTVTTGCLSKIIDHSKKELEKSICFVTGVPGAGKTLAGLKVANMRSAYDKEEHTVFLSGNYPLVAVLQEALIRDKITSSSKEEKRNKKEVSSDVKSLIQLIHHFRDDYYENIIAPTERVTIFDEAQRAWTHHQTAKFMKEKKGRIDFPYSEPEFLTEVMDRHKDWCVIICLVGGGQEINTGEAGLEEWIKPFKNKFQDWKIYYSPEIIEDKNYINNKEVITILNNRKAEIKKELHLSVSLRSFKSHQISNFVNALINNEAEKAKSIYLKSIQLKFPIFITRDLNCAKKWLREKSIAHHRVGIITSSGARRLRSFGINVKDKISPCAWFLNDRDDVRSSFFLEEVATEFDIQGLELDFTCVAWDGNLFYHDNQWNYRKFTGSTWKNVNKIDAINYLLNSYRVLLTRARQGMIIFIPYGDTEDYTRPDYIYDGTFEYLKSVGIEEI